MKTIYVLGTTLLLSGCHSENNSHSVQNKRAEGGQNQTVSISDTEMVSPKPDTLAILSFTKEDAETLTAKYYSEQNQDAKYPLYKGLGIQIRSFSQIDITDTYKVTARVTGRKWLRPTADTLTTPFEETIQFKAYRVNRIWWSDKLKSPGK
jgi:hypothetical protein